MSVVHGAPAGDGEVAVHAASVARTVSVRIMRPVYPWQHRSDMRTYVMGDPQATFAQVMAVLERNGVLAGDRLADDVDLISIGDHFDHDLADPIAAGRESMRVLRWLVAQGDRVTLLFGNHDAARVMELIGFDDARFTAARTLATSIMATKHAAGRDAANHREREELRPAFPDLPTYGLGARDYASYSTEQRALVIELLLAGRFHLGVAATLADGREALLTHAALTLGELTLLAIPTERDPRAIAARLDAQLAQSIADVRADWQRGVHTPLSLEPWHIAGSTGEEGGGLLYKRPADPDRLGADRNWEFSVARARRFDPRWLPRGLTQVAGHTGHHKALAELGATWPTAAARARAHGGIRTLRVTDDAVIYDMGVMPIEAGATDLILVDGEMRAVAAADYDLLALR